MISFRKTAIAALATVALGTSLAASPAQAHGFGGFHGGFHGGGFGWGLAGLGVGAALAAGAAAAYNSGCYYQDREWVDRFGGVHVRRYRVCN